MMAGLTVTLGLLGIALPVFDLFFRIAAALPIAIISTRFRWQVSLIACVSTLAVGFAVGGLFTAWSVAQSAFVAWILGELHRRELRSWAVWGASTLFAAFAGVGTLIFLLIFDASRQLALDAFRVTTQGYIDTLAYLPGTQSLTRSLHSGLHWMLYYWWIFIPALTWVSITVGMLLSSALLRRVLRRLRLREVSDLFDQAPPEYDTEIAPLPLTVSHVSHRYRDDLPLAVDDVSLHITAGEFIVIAGENGSGKSTLARCLAGFPPSSGTISSPGALGRGQHHGLAYLSQNADVHVVGNTVREDVAWGHEAATPKQRKELDSRVDDVLELVGLRDMASASTRHLSGGELQRLALAGALLHDPQVIISDETTAMIDPAGRSLMMELFRRLSAGGVAVVHITHDPSEASLASRLIRMSGGRIVFDGSPSQDPWVRDGHVRVGGFSSPHSLISLPGSVGLPHVEDIQSTSPAPASDEDSRGEALWVRHVGYVAHRKSPWKRTIIDNVSLFVEPGDSVLITGSNGSGKTTLARLMAGLLSPTWGEITLGSHAMWTRVGNVSLSHQFARLQLLRPTVGEDLLDAMGAHAPEAASASIAKKSRSTAQAKREHDADGLPVFTSRELEAISAALSVVGLDTAIVTRSIDELSGGQQRRVALAGLIAARPSVLILDEPFAGLDAQSRQLLVTVLSKQRLSGTSLVMISHDDDGLMRLADRHFHLVRGRIEGAEESVPSPRLNRVRSSDPISFPQPLPGDSVVKSMWAGSKILSWAAVSTALLFAPSWATVGIVSVYAFGLSLAARVPLSARPRVPFVVLSGFIGGIFGAWMGGEPLLFIRALLVFVLALWGTLILLWTTFTWQFTDAVSSLLKPLRSMGIPVQGVIHTMSLTVKSVPVFLDQARSLQDTMTIRLYRKTEITTMQILGHAVDVTTAALSAAAHRGVLIGQAISMRGGIPPVSWPKIHLSWRDALLTLWTLITVGAVLFFHLFW